MQSQGAIIGLPTYSTDGKIVLRRANTVYGQSKLLTGYACGVPTWKVVELPAPIVAWAHFKTCTTEAEAESLAAAMNADAEKVSLMSSMYSIMAL